MKMRRQKMSRQKSQRQFKRHARPFNHPVNRSATPQRGGIRL